MAPPRRTWLADCTRSAIETLLIAALLGAVWFYAGADQSLTDPAPGLGPVAAAIERRDLDALDRALMCPGAADAPDPYGKTPLVTACLRQDAPMVELLLRHGADVNASHEPYGTALCTAATMENLELLRLLIAAGADVNRQTAAGDTAFLHAARAGNLRVMRSLLDAGAAPMPTGAISSPLCYVTSDDDAEMLQSLLALRLDPNKPGRDGILPIVSAAERSPACVRALLHAGADPDRPDRSGRTARREAARWPAVAAELAHRPPNDTVQSPPTTGGS